jgi:hypothetical protein
MKKQYISLYSSARDSKSTNRIDIQNLIESIKNGEFKTEIEKIRNEEDKKKRSKLKQYLPAVTWSGEFEPRLMTGLIRHSGLICIDIDDAITDTQIEYLKKLSYVFCLFKSPSGFGVKVIFRVDLYNEKINSPSREADLSSIMTAHWEFFRGIADMLKTEFALEADESGKDLCRLCFVSYDPNIYVNPDPSWIPISLARAWMIDEKKEKNPKEEKNTSAKNPKPVAAPQPADQDLLEKVYEFTSNVKTYTPGKRNEFINTFCYNAKTHGIDSPAVISFCNQRFSDYEDGEKAILKIIKSVYNNKAIIYASKQFFEPKKPKNTGKTKENNSKPKPDVNQEYDETVSFWYETEVTDKATGEIKTDYRFDHDGMTFFLANNGFKKLKLGDRGFQFVRTEGNLIEAIEPEDINHFIMTYLHKDVKTDKDGKFSIQGIMDELHAVRRMYKRGIKNYSNVGVYNSVPALIPVFLRDNETTTYLYFKNAYVEITKDKKSLIEYSKLQGNLWKKQLKESHIELISDDDIKESDVYKFIKLAIIGKGTDDGKDEKRLLSMHTTIGYLVDTYKDPTNTKAPVFQDKKPNLSGNEANGGSGKTLTAKMIGKMINSCVLDGKSFKFEANYPYETFRADHKLIVYNDVNKRFPFDSLFHKVTEDFTYSKKYVDAIVIPHEDSPKHLVITNYSLSGEGSSFRRRQHIIEFCDYFNDTHTPMEEFKHRFFMDWDEKEWNRFFNFMIMCVQLYKAHGLVYFPAENVLVNKLLAEAGEEFIDFMDQLFIGSEEAPATHPMTKQDKDQLFEEMKNEIKRLSKMENTNKFTTWVKQWAEYRNLSMMISKSGAKRFFTFTEKEGAEEIKTKYTGLPF